MSRSYSMGCNLQVRVPTNIVSSICDDRGEEPTYNGVDMSTLIEGDYGVGDVISLLWFKRALPKYATRFIDMCVMLCADHGPCVSGKTTLISCPPRRQFQASALWRRDHFKLCLGSFYLQVLTMNFLKI